MKNNEKIQKATKEDANEARKRYKKVKDATKDVAERKQWCHKDEFTRKLFDYFLPKINSS